MTILITVGTGKTGRRVAERLQARGIDARAGSRSGQPPFDWEDPTTWAPALQGVNAVYIVYYPDLAMPGADELIRAFSKQAAAAGAQRLVLLSGRGEPEAAHAEKGIQDLGVDWTIIRSSWINQNFDEGFMLDSIRSGQLLMPMGEVPEPFVDADDIADVAVVALTEDGHAGQEYELTGPRLLTFDDVAADISKATGREITYVPVTAAEFAQGLAEEGLADLVGPLTDLFTRVLDGRNAHLTNDVRRALGREPRDFRDYAVEAAFTGVWDT